ncbi:cysteine-rich CWC family protein [Spirosoma knui]
MIPKHDHVACPRCQRIFECKVGSINLCQCQSIRLTDAQQQYVSSMYQGCLCSDCLLTVRTEYNQMIHQQNLNRLLHGH